MSIRPEKTAEFELLKKGILPKGLEGKQSLAEAFEDEENFEKAESEGVLAAMKLLSDIHPERLPLRPEDISEVAALTQDMINIAELSILRDGTEPSVIMEDLINIATRDAGLYEDFIESGSNMTSGLNISGRALAFNQVRPVVFKMAMVTICANYWQRGHELNALSNKYSDEIHNARSDVTVPKRDLPGSLSAENLQLN